MQWLNRTPNFDFMSHRRIAVAITCVLVLASIFGLAFRGLNLGLEFTGGVVVTVSFEQPVELDDVRRTLNAAGYDDVTLQTYGATSDVLIRLPPTTVPTGEGEASPDADASAAVAEGVLAALRADGSRVDLLDRSVVFPQVGEDLREQGGLAMLFALLMVFVYVALRFRWKFALGAIVATIHDVFVTVGFFALTGITFDLNVLASVLAVLGYSINDTIVVYDRIRENFRLMRRGTTEQIINASVNQTLARTLMTGVTTLLVLGGLIFLGGETFFGFSVALVVGILVGTFSSIYVASVLALWLKVAPADLMPPKREAVDNLP
ncbi:MAG TPA: protein translocase subunit SecF [Gammaproteobacteria bacterium]